MATSIERSYLNDPGQFSYWKKSPAPQGTGAEVMNYASPLARELWFYLRFIGHVKLLPRWKNEHHGEDGYVLHVVRRGEMWHEVKERRFVLRSGEAFLLDLSQNTTYGTAGNATLDLYWAWLNGKDMPRVFLELGADQNPVFPLADPQRAVTLMRKLQAITVREPAGYEVESSGLLTLLLAQLFSSRVERVQALSLGKVSRPLSDGVRKAIDYITRHYDKEIPVKHIAYIARQSLTYFSRRFHQEVGTSPIEYLNRYRIEQAKKFLAGSNQRVEQIARSVGFRNHNYFTRTFVRIVGVTPLAYRRRPPATSSRRTGR